MEFIEAHAKAAPDHQRHLGEQPRPVGIKQVVQSAPEPIVRQTFHLLGTDAEHPAGEPVHALLLTVYRLSFDDDGAQQHTKSTRMGDGAARVGGNVSIEQLFQTDPLDEVIDEG